MNIKRIMNYAKLLLSLVTMVSVMGLMYFIYDRSSEQIKTSVNSEHNSIINALDGHLKFFNKDNGNILNFFIDTPGLLKAIANKEKKDFIRKASHFYKKYQALEPSFFGMRISLKDGSTFVSINSEGMQYKDEDDYSQSALESQSIRIGFEKEALGYFYKIVYPLNYKDEFLGVIEFTYTIDAIVANLFEHFGINVAFVYKDKSHSDAQHTTLDNYIVQNISSSDMYAYTSKITVPKQSANFFIANKHLHVYTYELPDISHNAKIISFYDASDSIQTRQTTLNNLMILLLVLAAISIALTNMIINYLSTRVKQSETATKATNEELYFNSRHSSLSALPNTLVMQECIQECDNYSLILLSMDNVSLFNTSYGKDTFEIIIKESAKFLNSLLPENATLYHISVSEFIIILEAPTANQEYLVSSQIKSFFQQTPILVNDIQTTVSFSVGISSYSEEKDSKLDILSQANIALYTAQKQGKSIIVNYSDSMSNFGAYSKIAKNIAILQNDLEEDRLVPFYQPIVDAKTQQVFKYEVLARIKDESGKFISPFHFMEAAEASGLHTAITKQMIQKSFQYFEGTVTQFSVNITKHDFLENYLCDFLEQKTIKHSIDPRNVTLEILEDIAIENQDDIVKQINYLSSLGYIIAIDDFGVESSNMSKLSGLNAQFIKIDGSFIKDIDTNQVHFHIVESLVYIGKKLDMKIIAEYVHNQATYEVVRDLGIDYCQGYYFSEPKETT